MLSIDKLHKRFGKNQVLKGVDLQASPGRIYGIVGENGAGKTTLFRSVAGLENYEGDISYKKSPLKNYLGFLPTQPYFFSKITGKEYLQLLYNARGLKQIDFELKNVFNLPLGQYVSTYSTGMKKKLAITGILIQNNEIFILDEPFNGLDLQSNLMLVEIIKRLKQLNKIVLIASHIFSTLQEVCDEIHHLHEGKLLKKEGVAQFKQLEEEIKEKTIGNQIDRLNLQ